MAQPSHTLPSLQPYTYAYQADALPNGDRRVGKVTTDMSRPVSSMEAAMDEERREEERRNALNRLEHEKTIKAARTAQRNSLLSASTDGPASSSSVRDPTAIMGDIDDEVAKWHTELVNPEARAAARRAVHEASSTNRTSQRDSLALTTRIPYSARAATSISPIERDLGSDITKSTLGLHDRKAHPRSNSDASARPANINVPSYAADVGAIPDGSRSARSPQFRDRPSPATRLTSGLSFGSRSKSPITIASYAGPVSRQLILDNNERIAESARRASETQQGSNSSLAARLEKGRRPNSHNGLRPILKRDHLLQHNTVAVESSDEDDRQSSTEDISRGRAQRPKKRSAYKEDVPSPLSVPVLPDGGESGPDTDPGILSIKITRPDGEKPKNSRPGVHPTTAFDQTISGCNSPADSENEADASDIKRAQKLPIRLTPISSSLLAGRCTRTLLRGDVAKTVEEAGEKERRVRKFVVATDLSDEAAHALEWTIGTVLRDGDTLLAIYCIDEEEGVPPTLDARHVDSAVARTDGPDSAGHLPHIDDYVKLKEEEHRLKAVEDITTRVTKLLRKTRLQIRVCIEVLHCKSPKHILIEVIDLISPVMVILGSRGRSNIKTVILGSFSNYVVAKSSVPVMVARKKLRKHTKYKQPKVKLANNLPVMSDAAAVPSRRLTTAKID